MKMNEKKNTEKERMCERSFKTIWKVPTQQQLLNIFDANELLDTEIRTRVMNSFG